MIDLNVSLTGIAPLQKAAKAKTADAAEATAKAKEEVRRS